VAASGPTISCLEVPKEHIASLAVCKNITLPRR
jgi:hypothetical protein